MLQKQLPRSVRSSTRRESSCRTGKRLSESIDRMASFRKSGPIPASGTREGQTVSFAPGTLRFSVTAEVRVDGEPLFDGLPLTAEYGNDATATAIRGLDGTFYFVDATVETGEYTAVLNTQPSVLRRVQSPTRRLPDQP